MKKVLFAAVLLMATTSFVWAADVVENGKTIKFDYTLNVDGAEVETSKGKQPLEIVMGEGAIIPGLQSQILGMKVGETKKITVAPKDGYGENDPAAVQEIGKEKFPADFKGAAGMVVEIKPEGQEKGFLGMIKEVKDKTFLVDFNHPLAGKTLEFEITIVSVEDVLASVVPVEVAPVEPAPVVK